MLAGLKDQVAGSFTRFTGEKSDREWDKIISWSHTGNSSYVKRVCECVCVGGSSVFSPPNCVSSIAPHPLTAGTPAALLSYPNFFVPLLYYHRCGKSYKKDALLSTPVSTIVTVSTRDLEVASSSSAAWWWKQCLAVTAMALFMCARDNHFQVNLQQFITKYNFTAERNLKTL